MKFLHDAIQAQIHGMPFAWDMIEDVIVNRKALDKMKFIWDYVWTKRPALYTNRFYWRHVGMVNYFSLHTSLTTPYAVIDLPIPGVFGVYSDNTGRGWDISHVTWYSGTFLVNTFSHGYYDHESAYYGLIWNWYNWDY